MDVRAYFAIAPYVAAPRFSGLQPSIRASKVCGLEPGTSRGSAKDGARC